MRSVIAKVPLLAVPLALAEYVHTGISALGQLFDFHAHPFVSAAASVSFTVVVVVSAFCVCVHLSRLCLWLLGQLERANVAARVLVRRVALGLLRQAVASLETGASGEASTR